MNAHARIGIGRLALLCAALSSLQGPATGQEQAQSERLVNRVEELTRKAEELLSLGRHDEAAATLERARRAARDVQDDERPVRSDREYEELVDGLERGMVALERLGRRDALEMLARVANDVRAERREAQERRAARERREGRGEQGERGERRERIRQREADVTRQRLEILHVGLEALAEAGRERAAGVVERAIHAGRAALEGERVEGPELESVVEALRLAAEIHVDRGHAERAQAVAELAKAYALRSEGEGEGERERPARQDGERREARRRLAVMRYAVDVLIEVDRHDSADLVERAMHALELALEGRTDPEAVEIRRSAPDAEVMVELLAWASSLHAERGRGEKAQVLRDLAEAYRARPERQRTGERAERERRPERRQRRAQEGAERDRPRETDREAQRRGEREEIVQELRARLRALQGEADAVRAELDRLLRELERGRRGVK